MDRASWRGAPGGFVVALLFIVTAAEVGYCADDDEIVVGNTVVMMARVDVVLRKGPSDEAPATWEPPVARTLPVLDVKDGWVETTDGWARRSDLVATGAAIDYFTREIERRPTAFAYASRSVARRDVKEQEEKALDDAEAAVQADPMWPVSYQARGDALRGAGRFADAMADYNHALDLGPPLIASYAGLALAHWNVGAVDQALDDVRAALAVAPKNARTITLLAQVHGRKGMYDQAVAELSDLRDKAKVPWWHLKRCLSIALIFRAHQRNNSGQFAAALADLDEALQLDRDHHDLNRYRARGYALLKLGRFEAAAEALREAVRRDPRDARAHDYLGTALFKLRKYDSAVDHLSEAMRLGLCEANVYNSRGGAWCELGDNARAISDLDEAIRLDPAFGDAYANRALAEFRLGDIEAARRTSSARSQSTRSILRGASVWRAPTTKAGNSTAP